MKAMLLFSCVLMLVCDVSFAQNFHTNQEGPDVFLLTGSSSGSRVFQQTANSTASADTMTPSEMDASLDSPYRSNPYILGAGRNLSTSANLRYLSFGLNLASIAALTQDSDDIRVLGLGLGLGSTVAGLVSPYYIGKSGRSLAGAHLGRREQQAATSLQEYSDAYYDGLTAVGAGIGSLIAGGLVIDAEDEDMLKAVAIGGGLLTLGGALYSALVPPYHLGSAGGSLSQTTDPDMQRAGKHLVLSSRLQYASLAALVMGGLLLADSEDTDASELAFKVSILGVGAGVLNLIAHVQEDRAGAILQQVAQGSVQ